MEVTLKIGQLIKTVKALLYILLVYKLIENQLYFDLKLKNNLNLKTLRLD